MADYDPCELHPEYSTTIYETKQMRDTIKGASAVKNAGELYLPMPSAWTIIDQTGYTPTEILKYTSDYLPWRHKNPAYRAYLQRARFPDITANALRMCVGIATLKDPEIDLPDSMSYMEKVATNDFKSLIELYAFCISEILSVGKVALVVDFDLDRQQFYIATYTRENFVNYQEGLTGSQKIIKSASFKQNEDEVIDYTYDPETGKVISVKYFDGEAYETVELNYRGVDYPTVPVFYAGVFDNSPSTNTPALIGISDIAISIYQTEADLRQAQFMTCNPTLFVFGMAENEVPSVIGSQVIVSVRNPNARAEYPRTDTSALEHIRNSKKDMYEEAAAYGAALISSPSKEAAEALSIRQANRGASLVNAAAMAGKAINDALVFIATLNSKQQDDAYFVPNVEFAEMIMTSQDLTALVNAWIQGAINHDTLLDNMRDAGWIDSEGMTNDQIKDQIGKEKPAVDETLGDKTLDDK